MFGSSLSLAEELSVHEYKYIYVGSGEKGVLSERRQQKKFLFPREDISGFKPKSRFCAVGHVPCAVR
jgi:hypothetical protein